MILVALVRAFDGDLRAGMYAQVVVLSAVAAATIAAARRLRGWPSWLDALFPLLWLSWGNAMNLLWAWQLQMALTGGLLAAAACVIAHVVARPTADRVSARAALPSRRPARFPCARSLRPRRDVRGGRATPRRRGR